MSREELKEIGIVIPESACDMYDDEMEDWMEYAASGRYSENKIFDTYNYFNNKSVK